MIAVCAHYRNIKQLHKLTAYKTYKNHQQRINGMPIPKKNRTQSKWEYEDMGHNQNAVHGHVKHLHG
jgi:hypothetical protein